MKRSNSVSRPEEFEALKAWFVSERGLNLVPGDKLNAVRRAAAETAVRQVCPNLISMRVERMAGRTCIRCVLEAADGVQRAITVLRARRTSRG